MKEELSRVRTNVLMSVLLDKAIDIDGYVNALDRAVEVKKEDMALLSSMAGMENPPYQMRSLKEPLPVSSMVIPESASSFFNGQSKVSTNYTEDWPQSDASNPFGEHHPFGMKSSCCPLLHGAAHGEPEYAHHIIRSINDLEAISSGERTHDSAIRSDQEYHQYAGALNQSQYDLYKRDRQRSENSFKTDESYMEEKKNELMQSFGMLPYLFGMEYQTSDQRSNGMDLLVDLANTSGIDSPESRSILNKMQERTGMQWGRMLRNWRCRFTPMLHWWTRPSDRHGPTVPSMSEPHMSNMHSPFVGDGNRSYNYHWWEPFMHWGGVGRSVDSFDSVLRQSYPDIFNSWLSEFLIHNTNFEMLQHANDGGSHFPELSSSPLMQGDPTRFAIESRLEGTSNNFSNRRANWSHASNHHHMHPSEINEDVTGRMVIPNDAMMLSPLGRQLAVQTDMGGPRIGIGSEPHPTSNETYWMTHNNHFKMSDENIGRAIGNLSRQVMKQFGPQVLNPIDPTDPVQGDIARGNLQQIAAAANHMLMHSPTTSYRSVAPTAEGMKMVSIGPVSNKSRATTPPVYLSGNTDAWGHMMPATLAWRHDPEQGTIFDLKDEPFQLMQRTAHAGHVAAALPSLLQTAMSPKPREINALDYISPTGLNSIMSQSLQKADDYEPTGVFETMIEPAHTLYDLDDMNTLKGFSGDYVIQKMPKGERMLVEKKGATVKPSKIPNKIKKQLKEMKGDFTLDAYLNDEKMNVVDLLVHKGTDMHMEPLEDRINALRTLYQSTEEVNFPMPSNCVFSDDEGLAKAVAEMKGANKELIIRDAYSTFMKGRDTHPKWIRLVNDDDISKLYPTIPDVSFVNDSIVLDYPSIPYPVIAKGSMEGNGFNIESYDGPKYLIKHARRQLKLWGPVAFNLIKEGGGAATGGGSSGGTFTSSTAGTNKPVHSTFKRRRPRKRRSSQVEVIKAPAVIDEDDPKSDDVSDIMSQVRRFINNSDEAKTSNELCNEIKGLKPKMLEVFGPEFGIEQTEDKKKWTVNEAIDDDIVERFAYPRMNRASPDGGAWSGMQADITAPRGPTELVDDSGTTFGDPREGEADEENYDRSLHIRIAAQRGFNDDAEVEVDGERAVLRIPRHTPEDEEDEQQLAEEPEPVEEIL